jgi:imidazolonepropionase-like amidohydrolase
MKLFLSVFSFVLISLNTMAQVTTFPENGAPDFRSGYFAVKASNIQIAPDSRAANAWLLFRDGRIEGVVSEGAIPKDAVEVDLGEYFIYPSFVDVYSDYGLVKPEKEKGSWDPQFVTDKEGAYAWNEALKSEISAKGIRKTLS